MEYRDLGIFTRGCRNKWDQGLGTMEITGLGIRNNRDYEIIQELQGTGNIGTVWYTEYRDLGIQGPENIEQVKGILRKSLVTDHYELGNWYLSSLTNVVWKSLSLLAAALASATAVAAQTHWKAADIFLSISWLVGPIAFLIAFA